MSFLNNCPLQICEIMAIFGNFREKNGNFLAIFEKKWQFSDNFWTFNWQFSGGSDLQSCHHNLTHFEPNQIFPFYLQVKWKI